MGLPVYLAMTEAEMAAAEDISRPVAYMACHFSAYGSGLSELPEALPADCLLILDDRIPVWEHDPRLIVRQLTEVAEEAGIQGLLLDFQRPGCARTAQIAREIFAAIPCPVAATEEYCGDGAVFLPPIPPNVRPEDWLCAWAGREVWLDLSPTPLQITVEKAGSHSTRLSQYVPEGTCHRDQALCCSYTIQVLEDRAVFTLLRTGDDLQALLQRAEALGVTHAVGLYQELHGLV